MRPFHTPSAESLLIYTQPSGTLKNSQIQEINRLRRTSLQLDFPDRRPTERDAFILGREHAIKNPNKAIGDGVIRARQRYARSQSVMAVHMDGNGSERLIAQLTVADNASVPAGRHPLMRPLELGMKLYTSDWEIRDKLTVHSRWYWLGLLAVSRAGRSMIEESQQEKTVNIVDLMIAAGARARDERQPSSAYPYAGESLWKQVLQEDGFGEKATDQEPVYAFGKSEHSMPLVQEHWTIASIGELKRNIFAKENAESLFHKLVV